MARSSGRDPELRAETEAVLEEASRAVSKAAAYMTGERMRVLPGDFITEYLADDLPSILSNLSHIAAQMGDYNETRQRQSYSEQKKRAAVAAGWDR